MRPLIIYPVLLLLLVVQSCSPKTFCNEDSEENLGKKEFSAEFKSYNIEEGVNSMVFTNDQETLEIGSTQTEFFNNRVNDHEICRSFDIKPYIAYAYYTFDKLSKFYQGDELLLTIEPVFHQYNGDYFERIYLNLSYGISTTIKGYVRVSPDDNVVHSNDSIQPFAVEKNYELDGKTFDQLWIYEDGEIGIYYNKDKGIVAIKREGKIYFRK